MDEKALEQMMTEDVSVDWLTIKRSVDIPMNDELEQFAYRFFVMGWCKGVYWVNNRFDVFEKEEGTDAQEIA